ncbi:hypothetical protein Pfo_010186 [Paulownia fortunei]|nr:hypothetical protein Pfo_010186 [Paulownia fortunei]
MGKAKKKKKKKQKNKNVVGQIPNEKATGVRHLHQSLLWQTVCTNKYVSKKMRCSRTRMMEQIRREIPIMRGVRHQHHRAQRSFSHEIEGAHILQLQHSLEFT